MARRQARHDTLPIELCTRAPGAGVIALRGGVAGAYVCHFAIIDLPRGLLGGSFFCGGVDGFESWVMSPLFSCMFFVRELVEL